MTCVVVEADLSPLLLAAGLQTYDDYVNCRLGEVVAHSGTTLTRRITLTDGARHETVYLKRYAYVGQRWRHRFRRDKAGIEVRNFRLLRERCGIGVPDVLAFGARRRGLRLLDAFLMTRAIENAVSLEDWAARQTSPSRADRAALLRRSAAMVARMHLKHFCHCDLQWRNILVRRGGPAFEMFLIDSARGGVRRTIFGRRHGQTRDLAQLDKLASVRLSRAERVRWLRLYADELTGHRHEASSALMRRLTRSARRYAAEK